MPVIVCAQILWVGEHRRALRGMGCPLVEGLGAGNQEEQGKGQS